MITRLKQLRELKALSLSDLADLSRVTINRIENGKQKPMPRTLRRLAAGLGVCVEELTTKQPRLFEGKE